MPIADEAFREAPRLRTELGLRSDRDHILAVANDPTATVDLLSIPLLPDEVAELTSRATNADAVASVVNAYASAHLDEFGGLYIDNLGGGTVVVLWTANLGDHVRAIMRQLSPTADVEFRAVRYSQGYLEDLMSAVVDDSDWMAQIPASWQGTGVDVIRNRVLITVSSAEPNAATLIRDHYDFRDALEVESDGTGVALIPWGEVHGTVRPDGGDVPPPADYSLRWHGGQLGDCGGSDSIGYGVTATGTFEVPCQVGEWTIEVVRLVGDEWVVVGAGTVLVVADQVATVEILLDEVPRS